MNSLLAVVHPYIVQYGYGALFGVLFTESFGLPLPGETFLVAASFLAVQGQLNVWLVGLTAWTAAVLGDNLGYVIGRFGGRRLLVRHGAPVGISVERLNKTEHQPF
jgi:membrane protein DedA with SNARE-associated domain